MNERLIGLDYGDKTIGVAVSDPLGTMALGVETIRRTDVKDLKSSFLRLSSLLSKYAPVTTIVLGYPKNLDNTEGERCKKTLAFKTRLERNFKAVAVELWDERLSTAGARRTISNMAAIDEMAAVFILQGYMDYQRKRRSMEEFDPSVNDLEISMFDDDDNEIVCRVLAGKEFNGCMYMLTEEIVETEKIITNDKVDEKDKLDEKDEKTTEVIIFKCIGNYDQTMSFEQIDEEMRFEVIDESHEEFEAAFALFKGDFKSLGIEC